MSNQVNGFFCKCASLGSLVLLSALGQAAAQSFTRADSGWVRIWNGKDWTENAIYSRVYGATAPLVYPPDPTGWQILYAGTDTAAIYVSTVASNKQGNIGTKKTSYSHYRMRVEGKFDVLGENASGGDNAGITYHTDETADRMSNNWPRSIEFQMRQIETGSAFSIQHVTFDTKVTSNAYNPNGTAVKACASGCDRRNYNGNPRISNGSNGVTRWLRYELVARGSDSAIHIVNDTVVFRLSNIRIYNDITSNNTPDGPWDHGAICLQSEGAMVKYRRWEIMEFPAGTPKGENFLHRLFLDNPDQGVTIAPGSTYAIKWRSLGTIPTVNIEYRTGTGAWQSIAAGISNTGTYNWAVPSATTTQLQVRLSGPAWAAADSSSGNNSIGTGTSLDAPGIAPGPVSFSIEGKGEVLAGIENYSRLEIRDVFGRSVRHMAIKGENLFWDRRDAKGTKVQPGIYFLRLLGPGAEKTERSLIF